jgi:hypothetical protein
MSFRHLWPAQSCREWYCCQLVHLELPQPSCETCEIARSCKANCLTGHYKTQAELSVVGGAVRSHGMAPRISQLRLAKSQPSLTTMTENMRFTRHLTRSGSSHTHACSASCCHCVCEFAFLCEGGFSGSSLGQCIKESQSFCVRQNNVMQLLFLSYTYVPWARYISLRVSIFSTECHALGRVSY